ncbi:MAG TPA: histone deacetylase [Acidimicrobiia bacterium]|nr:histone deacetylase [Acidimicrobiia bacterium]
MEILYVTHPSFVAHDTGSWHPERPARLAATERGVWSAGLGVRRVEAELVDRDLLSHVHTDAYVAALERFCAAGGGPLDADTVAVEASWEAALRAAGAGPQSVRLLVDAVDTTAFLAVRPPGHHALAAQAMGFCLFNNAVVTAAALKADGYRVAIVDWDVHHGNGTQAMTWNDPDVLYISTHQYPFYPMTGSADERGGRDAPGTVINVPLPAGSAGDVYREIFGRIVVPALHEFRPDWILVSAGYDAHASDPLADLALESGDYGMMAAALAGVLPPHRIVTFLEGGYHLAALTAAVGQTLRGYAGRPEADGAHRVSPPEAFAVVDRVERSLR